MQEKKLEILEGKNYKYKIFLREHNLYTLSKVQYMVSLHKLSLDMNKATAKG